MRSFPGRTQPRRLAYWAPNLLYLALPLVLWKIRGPRPAADTTTWVVMLATAVVAGIWYLRAISGKPVLLRLDGATLVAGRCKFLRADVTTELRRWVDAWYGTTAGSALLLRQGAQSLAVGCKGPAPAEHDAGLPAITDVRIVLAAADFDELRAALERDQRPRPAPSGAQALTVSLVPSPASPRELWRTSRWLLVIIAMAGVMARFVTSAPPLPRSVLTWLPGVIAGAGVVLWWFRAQRPPSPRYLVRVEQDTIACLDARTSKTLGRCALRDLGVERGRYLVTGRFGRAKCPTLVLRWPGGPKLYLGPTGWGAPVDEGLPRSIFAPRVLVGQGEWDALGRALHR